jgi:hypothetical protein
MLPNMPEFATKDHFQLLRFGSIARLSGRIHRRRMWPRQFGGMS